jgi:preprotein translocase subunit YajC
MRGWPKGKPRDPASIARARATRQRNQRDADRRMAYRGDATILQPGDAVMTPDGIVGVLHVIDPRHAVVLVANEATRAYDWRRLRHATRAEVEAWIPGVGCQIVEK